MDHPPTNVLKPQGGILPSAFSFRIALITVAIVALASLAVGGLGFLKFCETYDSLLMARLRATASEISEPVKTSLTLGLQLTQLDSMSDLVRREAANDPNILGLDIVDDEGRILYSNRPDMVGHILGGLLKVGSAAGGGEPIGRIADGRIQVVAPLFNTFDEPVGEVVLRYSPQSRQAAQRSVFMRILEGAVLLIGLAALTAPFVAARIFAGFEGQVRRVLAELYAAFDPRPDPDPKVMEGRLARFAASPIGLSADGGEISRDAAAIVAHLKRQAGSTTVQQGAADGVALVAEPRPKEGADRTATLRHRLFLLVILYLLVFSSAASWWALHAFGPALEPELEAKAATVGRSVAAKIARALDAEVPMAELVGVSELFDEVIRLHPELGYLAVTDADGKILYQGGAQGGEARFQAMDAAGFDAQRGGRGWLVLHGKGGLQVLVPVLQAGAMPALIGIGVDPAFLGHVRSQMILDILTVLLVACLVAVEILLVVTGATSLQIGRWKGLAEAAAAGRFGDLPSARAHGGMGALFDWYEQARQAVRAGRGRAEETAVAAAPAMVGTSDRSAFNIAGMRLSIFLFVLGEEMIRPFIPLFARQLAAGGPVPPNWVAAAPIGVFMLIWALSQLFGPGVSSILGGRRSLALSAILSAFSMVMMGLADGFSGFMIWRCLEAVGFGMVLFTAQGIVLANTGLDNRGAGFAAYVGGILTAGVCGPALGGVAAEQLGLTADFVIGGSMFLVSLVAFLTLTGEESDSAAAGASVLSKNTLSLFSSRRLLSILGLSGLPNRLATTAILFYVFPLYLTAAGIGKAGVGRVLLLYYVGYILSTPMSVRLAERFSLREVFVVGGGLLSGAACLIFLLHPSPWLVSLSCFLLGLAQGPSTLQASLLTTSCKADRLAISESAALGVFRFSERIGSSMAPFLAAALTAPFGYGGAASGMGVVLSIASVLFLLLFRSPGRGGLDQEA